MKRLVLVIIVISLVLFGACAPTAAPPTPPTPSPAEQPAPEPPEPTTPAPEDVTPTPPEKPPVKPQIRGVTDYFDMDYYNLVGEVFNSTDSNIDFVKVVATFYDKAGTVIGTSFTYTELDIILPNDAAPFEISSYPDKIQPASCKLSSDYNATTEQPFVGLSIKSHSVSIDDMGFHEIVGEIENNSTMPAEFVKIVATYYNSSEDIIGTAFTFTDIDVVQAGDTAPFELSSYPREINPASYKLQVEGQRA